MPRSTKEEYGGLYHPAHHGKCGTLLCNINRSTYLDDPTHGAGRDHRPRPRQDIGTGGRYRGMAGGFLRSSCRGGAGHHHERCKETQKHGGGRFVTPRHTPYSPPNFRRAAKGRVAQRPTTRNSPSNPARYGSIRSDRPVRALFRSWDTGCVVRLPPSPCGCERTRWRRPAGANSPSDEARR